MGKQGLFFHMRCDFSGFSFTDNSESSGVGCLLSNSQGFVFKRSRLLVSFIGISWVAAQTFPCAGSGPSTDGHTQSLCICWGHLLIDRPTCTLTFWYPYASLCLPF